MKKEGFTLIEMLIVVAIIGLLSSVVLVGLGDVRKEARDARRLADIRQMQNALELYYSDKQNYPADIYDLPGTPYDPLPDPDTQAVRQYAYEKVSNNNYRLGACLEGPRPTGISHIMENMNTSIDNFGSCNCDDAGNKAYCVKN
jgi:prepilin-type N-terminal cleavage/methylation domain-containing protein